MDGKEWRKKNRIDYWEHDSDSHVFIYSQEELDEVPDDYTGCVHIKFGTEEKRAIIDRDLSARIYGIYAIVFEIRKPTK